MLKLETGMFNDRGFTLVEILVVLLIIGITLSFAMLAFGDFGAKRRAVFATEQLVNDIKLVEHQAILETRTYGFWVYPDSYRVFRFNAEGQWEPVNSHRIFRQHFFPKPALLRLREKLGSSKSPQIVISETGDISPFHLLVEMNEALVAEVIGLQSGLIQLKLQSSS